MAVTKIWAITDSISRVLSYAANPDKTIYSDICKALHYASDERKTVIGEEKVVYVTGVNCTAETAFAEMKAVQERFDKTVGNVAYHAYQSFKTGEVTPQLAHKLGVELAKRMWGDQYQVLVATHFNTGTYHNHLVINSVNMWNGKKFNCNEGAYWKLRSISDELCKENGLTVIKNPKGKTPRKLYFAEKNGEPTRYNLMREAIDKALTMSTNPKAFAYVMKQLGYALAAIQHGKLIHTHQFLAQLLIVQRMGNLAATALAGVIAVDGFLAQRRRQLFQRTGFLTTQKDGTVHVADDRIRAVFIQGFKLALCL